MSINKYFLIFFSLVVLGLSTSARPVLAFSISPVKILLTLDQNNSETIILRVTNSEKKDTIFKFGVLGMQQDESGKPRFVSGITNAESWVYPENNNILIKAGETKSVNFILKIPDNSVAGSYYMGLFAQPIIESGNAVSTKLVSLLTVQVAGDVYEKVDIDQWVTQSKVVNNKKWNFNLSLKNNGPVEVVLKGEVAINNWRGKEILAEPVVLGNKLLAGSRRALSPVVMINEGVKLPGLYQAQIKINYGLTSQRTSGVTYVWYFPGWSLVILLILASLILISAFYLIKRKR